MFKDLREESLERLNNFLSRSFEWNNEDQMLMSWSLNLGPVSEDGSPSAIQQRTGMDRLSLVSYSEAATGLFWKQSILKLCIFNCHLEMPAIAQG